MSQNREIMAGETMFEYLKRKKRFLLEKTVTARLTATPTARQPLQERSLNQSMDCDPTKREELEDRTRRDASRDRDYSTSRSTLKDKNEATTKRASIIQQARRPAHRSFIQMISPIRSKSPAREADRSTGKEAAASRKEGVAGRKEGAGRRGESFTRRQLTEKMNLMRDTIESQLKAGKSLKEKAHLLFLDLKPFFRHLENCGEAGFERKTEEIRGKVRAMESVFKEFNAEAHHSTIDHFYMLFSQYLNELDGQARAEIEENKDALAEGIASVKDTEIYELKDENAKLQKEVAVLAKKYSKLERGYEELLDQAELKLSEKELRYQEKVQRLEAQLGECEARRTQLLEEVQALREAGRQQEEERRQLVAQRQRFEEECLNTITRVKSEQEEFLLNEIVVLKKEFHADISKMAELYRIKEDDLLRKGKEQQAEAQRLERALEELMASNKRLDEAAIALHAQNARVKKQNECLATDMHRINEELYQHWLALKDIRTLSQRLDIFAKFKKIYEELLFNDQLFL